MSCIDGAARLSGCASRRRQQAGNAAGLPHSLLLLCACTPDRSRTKNPPYFLQVGPTNTLTARRVWPRNVVNAPRVHDRLRRGPRPLWAGQTVDDAVHNIPSLYTAGGATVIPVMPPGTTSSIARSTRLASSLAPRRSKMASAWRRSASASSCSARWARHPPR